MSTQDKCCTIAPYFKVKAGQLEMFRQLCDTFIAKTKSEPGCLYYGFALAGDVFHCREGYADAEALLAHVTNVSATIEEALKISKLIRLEVHGPESELAKLRAPLAALKPTFFALECGFRR